MSLLKLNRRETTREAVQRRLGLTPALSVKDKRRAVQEAVRVLKAARA